MSKPITRKVQALNEKNERVWITLSSPNRDTLTIEIDGSGKLYCYLPRLDEFITAAQRKHLNKLDTRPIAPHRDDNAANLELYGSTMRPYKHIPGDLDNQSE